MNENIIKFTLKQQQYDFIGCPLQFPAYVGGIGTGKSAALIIKALFHSYESPNNLGVIVRKNYTDLRDSTLRDFEDYTGRKVNKDSKEVKLPNGSVIMFRHGDELPTLKNLNLGFFAIEQAEEFADSLPWDMLIQRLRRKVSFRTGFLIANANGHNWIWSKWVKDKPPKNHALMEATTYDYKDILPDDYIDNLESMLPKKLFNRFVMNSHDEAEGRIFDEFNFNRHVVEPIYIPDTWKQGFCLDHGYRNPTAVLFYAIDYDGTLYIYDEHYEKEKPVSYHSQRIKIKGHGTKGLADPSIFSKTQQRGNYVISIADEYKEHGITLIPALKEAEQARIARTNELLKQDKIKIFSTCTNTIREVSEWKWQEMRPGYKYNPKEEPEDKNNHTCDCLNYIVCSRLRKPENPKAIQMMHTPEYLRRQRIQPNNLKYTSSNLQRYKHI